MKIIKIISTILLFVLNATLFSQSNNDQNEIDCINMVSNTKDIITINQCLKILAKNESYYKVLKLVSKIDSTEILGKDDASQNLEIKYETLKLACQLSRRFYEHSLNQKLENLLLRLVGTHPKLLLSDLTKINNKKSIDALILNKFLEEFGFYLFSRNAKQNTILNSIDDILKEIINKLIYLPSLKKEIESLEGYKLIVGEGSRFIKKKIFDKEILYYFNGKMPDKLNMQSRCDTITISHYYPLDQWREPIFISYNFNSKNALDEKDKIEIFYETNLNRILK